MNEKYNNLFEHMFEQHNLNLDESQMEQIMLICDKIVDKKQMKINITIDSDLLSDTVHVKLNIESKLSKIESIGAIELVKNNLLK